jgi:hypothetical protein
MINDSKEFKKEVHKGLIIFPKNLSLDEDSLKKFVENLKRAKQEYSWFLANVPPDAPGNTVRVIGQHVFGNKEVRVFFSMQKIDLLMDAIPDEELDEHDLDHLLEVAEKLKTALLETDENIKDLVGKRFGILRNFLLDSDVKIFAKNVIKLQPEGELGDFEVRTTDLNTIEGSKYNLIRTYKKVRFEERDVLFLAIDYNSHQEHDLNLGFSKMVDLINKRRSDIGNTTEEVFDRYVKTYAEE